MTEPIDIYSDQFQVNTGPYGSNLNFFVSGATPPAPGAPAQAQRLASVRMSLEHLKVMTFVMHRQVVEYERNSRVNVQVPLELLNSLRISSEDWESFWRHSG